MGKVLVAYYSRTGKTQRMAEAVAAGVRAAGVEAELKAVQDVSTGELGDYDGFIFGSPTYYGSMAWEMKKLLDESVQHHGRLAGKVGGAFSSSANLAGGNETTILDILKAFLVHGMIIQGAAQGDHFGPISIGMPNDRSLPQCEALGRRVGELVQRLFPA
jgi:NAD(P)H dehydrogenase (quinone)